MIAKPEKSSSEKEIKDRSSTGSGRHRNDQLCGMRMRSWLSICLVVVLFGGCANRDLNLYKARLGRSQCRQWQPGQYTLPPVLDTLRISDVPEDVARRFSPNSLHVAHAIGLLPLLHEYTGRLAVPAEGRNLEQRLELLELRRKLAYRCDLASLEISAMASELDCEEEKLSQLGTHLSNLERNTERSLTVAAIAVGALGAVASGLELGMDEENHVDRSGILFGVAEAGIGVAILLNGKKTTVRHERNALRAINDGSDPDAMFPPFVWYVITRPIPGEASGRTLRAELLARWQEDEGRQRKQKQAAGDLGLIMGDGGKYSPGQLAKRAAMYDQLESTIKLVKQDLLQLVRELDDGPGE